MAGRDVAGSCPADSVMQDYIARDLDAQSQAAFEEHLAACEVCRGLVRILQPPVEAASTERGASYGRFRLRHRVGEGSFGAVWLARDPKIDRDVALKILSSNTAPDEAATREARALGRVDHPNLVTVFEVDRADDQPYIAMEWINGVSIREWAVRKPRWRDRLGAVIQAGRGLEALHGVDVLHRDIKPANVLVDAQGRVRIVDLGLARIGDGAPESDPPNDDSEDTAPAGGSPAYMAPELWHGRAAHERSDQFSFCVMAYECLFGRRPFEGATGSALLHAMDRGEITTARTGNVPRWVRRTLARGLTANPSQRWPSMHALLDELEAGLDRGRRWRSRAALATLGVTLLAGTAWWMNAGFQHSRCIERGDAVATIWNGQVAEQLDFALAESGLPHATSTAERTIETLDGYAAAWRRSRVETCEATRVDGRASRDLLQRRVACLDSGLVELEASVAMLLSARPAVVDRAHALVGALGDPAACFDRPAESIARADQAPITTALSRAAVQRRAGQLPQAHAITSRLLEMPEVVDDARLRGKVHHELASVLWQLGRAPQSKASLDIALDLALAERDWTLARDTASLAAFVVGAKLDQPEAGLVYADIAEGLLPPEGALQARSAVAHHRHVALLAAQRFDDAVVAERESLRYAIEQYGPHHLEVATSREGLGETLRLVGDAQGAVEEHTLALDIRRDLLGASHPHVALSHHNIATVLVDTGELDAAEGHILAAIEVEDRNAQWSAALGPMYNTLGIVRAELGQTKPALEAFERSVTLEARRFGATHVMVGEALLNLARMRKRAGDLDAARADISAALSILRRERGPRHLSLARALDVRAAICAELGEAEEALAADRLALEIKREALGDAHVLIAAARLNTAESLIALERWSEAETEVAQAVVVLETNRAKPTRQAHAHLLMARVLAAQNRDPSRARQLAERARALLTSAEGDQSSLIAEVDAVLSDLQLRG